MYALQSLHHDTRSRAGLVVTIWIPAECFADWSSTSAGDLHLSYWKSVCMGCSNTFQSCCVDRVLQLHGKERESANELIDSTKLTLR